MKKNVKELKKVKINVDKVICDVLIKETKQVEWNDC